MGPRPSPKYNWEVIFDKAAAQPVNAVLIFPGWVNHRSQVNKVGGERMVMTYNINARLFKCDVYENRFVLPNTLNAA